MRYQTRDGTDVDLTPERAAHIRAEHPEMALGLDFVERTLAEPEFIIESVTDSESTLYYRLVSTGTPLGDKYLCVVVRDAEGRSYILTAYFTDRVKKGTVIWQTG